MIYKKKRIVIVGLGYTGLPLAVAFAKKGFKIIGFDINKKRINELNNGLDINGEVSKEELKKIEIDYTSNNQKLQTSDFYIVCVPTLLDKKRNPDLTSVKKACITLGKNLKKGVTVIFESSVFPGVTEEFCLTLLEKYSHLKAGKDFYLGFSSERINPGDKNHSLENIVKVVAGINQRSLEKIADLYGNICFGGIYKASSIKVAELAKLLENIQRDVNIALMNEITLVCQKLNISIWEVIETAATKWNFCKFYPGLVGGYCVPVNPYYLLYKANKLKTSLPLVKTARLINELMVKRIIDMISDSFINSKKDIKKANILVLGITFRPNIREIRSSRIIEVIKILKNKGANIFVYDPLVAKKDIEKIASFYIEGNRKKFDMVIVNSYHNIMKNFDLEAIKKIVKPSPILIDLPYIFSKKIAGRLGFQYVSY